VKKLFLFLLILVCASLVDAQVILKGSVLDSATYKPMSLVRVENMTSHKGDFTSLTGEFSIEGKEGDYIIFSYVGFKNKTVRLRQEINNVKQSIFLSLKPVNLQTVIIKQGPTEYQKDSAYRADTYKDIFNYEQSKSVMSPVTSIYQKFSKKHKQIRHFQEQIVDNEQQKFIDTRYTPELVSLLTKLNEDDLADFMKAYPMEYEYARAASDLEIKMWIKYNFQEYSKKKK
jgi:hypothetical protein